MWRAAAPDGWPAGGSESGDRAADGRAGGGRGLAVRRDLWPVWGPDGRRLSGGAGAAPDVRATDRGPPDLLPRAPSRRVRAAGRAVSGRVWAHDQPGRRRERPTAAGRAGAADVRGDPGDGPWQPGHQLGRDECAGSWEDPVAVDVSDPGGELPPDRAEPWR